MAWLAARKMLRSPLGTLGLLPRIVSIRTVTVRVSQQKFKETDYAGLNAPLDPYSIEKRQTKQELRGHARPQEQKDSNCADVTKRVRELIRKREYTQALELFRQVEKADAILFDSALNACAKGLLYNDAWKIWDEMPPESKSVVSYSTMLDMCKRLKKTNRAEKLIDEMKRDGLEPNAITYNIIISLYSMAGLPSKALETFEVLRASHLAGSSAQVKQMTYLAVMSAFARVGDYAKSRELCVEMMEGGTPPNNMHANALLTSCAKAPDAPTAQLIFNTMPAWNLVPRVEEYNILMSCCRHDLPRCVEILAELRSAGLEPTGRAYQQLLEAHVLAKDGPGAKALLSQVSSLDRQSSKVKQLIDEVERLSA